MDSTDSENVQKQNWLEEDSIVKRPEYIFLFFN